MLAQGRGLKQTLDRAKLRSRNDRRLLVELDWSILAMAVAELFALQEQLAPRPHKWPGTKVPHTPLKRSLAKTMRAIRGCIRRPYDTPDDHERLATLLHQAVTDGYQRKRLKSARYRPPNPDKKPLGEPTVRQLNEKEIKTMRLIGQKSAA